LFVAEFREHTDVANCNPVPNTEVDADLEL
jgi:hypothetical protein